MASMRTGGDIRWAFVNQGFLVRLVRFDLSNMYIQLLSLSLIYLCLWQCNFPLFPVSQKILSLTSCRAFNHTASCQTGSGTSIVGLKINMILKGTIFITHKLWLLGWNEKHWCLSIIVAAATICMICCLSVFKDICCSGKKNTLSHEVDVDDDVCNK